MKPLDDPRHDREAGSRDATRDTTRTDDTRIGAVRALISPALLLEEHIGRGELVALTARGFRFRRKFYLLTHRRKFKTDAMLHWLELCQEKETPHAK